MNRIEAAALHKIFERKTALEALSLSIPAGEIFGLLGSNGSGKSTALRILAGVLPATSGRCSLDGVEVAPSRRAALAPALGYMPQRFSLYEDLTAAENLHFFATVRGVGPAAVEDWKVRLSLDPVWSEQARTLSHGWRQRLALAAAVLHQPRVLLLDEPTAGVDFEARHRMWDALRGFQAAGAAILITTHSAEDAAHCDRLAYLVQGKVLVNGRPPEIQRSAPTLEEALRLLAAETA